MIGILNSFLDIITSFVGFVINTFTSIIVLIGHIPTFVSFATSSAAYLPTMVLPFVLASVSIYVVLFILGRS